MSSFGFVWNGWEQEQRKASQNRRMSEQLSQCTFVLGTSSWHLEIKSYSKSHHIAQNRNCKQLMANFQSPYVCRPPNLRASESNLSREVKQPQISCFLLVRNNCILYLTFHSAALRVFQTIQPNFHLQHIYVLTYCTRVILKQKAPLHTNWKRVMAGQS